MAKFKLISITDVRGSRKEEEIEGDFECWADVENIIGTNELLRQAMDMQGFEWYIEKID